MPRCARRDLENDVAILAMPPGLSNKAPSGSGRPCDRLAIGHARLADVGADLELAQHTVDEHLEMQLAHPRNKRLAGVLVKPDLKGRVLFGQALKRGTHLVLIGVCARLNRHRDDGIGKGDRLEQQRLRCACTAFRL